MLIGIIIILILYIFWLQLKCIRLIQNPTALLRNIVHNRRIILVGNGPSIKRKHNGRKIDSFDVVIRFNSYKIFPKYTGKKTTIHVQSEDSALFHDFSKNAIPITVSSQLRSNFNIFKDNNLIYKPDEIDKILSKILFVLWLNII